MAYFMRTIYFLWGEASAEKILRSSRSNELAITVFENYDSITLPVPFQETKYNGNCNFLICTELYFVSNFFFTIFSHVGHFRSGYYCLSGNYKFQGIKRCWACKQRVRARSREIFFLFDRDKSLACGKCQRLEPRISLVTLWLASAVFQLPPSWKKLVFSTTEPCTGSRVLALKYLSTYMSSFTLTRQTFFILILANQFHYFSPDTANPRGDPISTNQASLHILVFYIE